MHRCLQVTEIAFTVAQYVLDLHAAENTAKASEDVSQVHTDRSMHPLVSLGLTCKLLWAPAMDVLWSDLEGVEPLLMCFPIEVCRRDFSDNWVRAAYMLTPVCADNN